MIRQIIIPKEEIYNLKLPKRYINKKIEIIIKLCEEENRLPEQDLFSLTSGILKEKNIDPVKWQREIRNDREISC